MDPQTDKTPRGASQNDDLYGLLAGIPDDNPGATLAGGPGDDPYGLAAGVPDDDPFGLLAGIPDGVTTEALLAILADRGSLGADGPSEAEDAAPGDQCPDCGCLFEAREMAYVCPRCHLVREAANFDDVLPPPSLGGRPNSRMTQGRLRIVGRDSGYYQPDLDRTNPVEYSEVQKKVLIEELHAFNTDYNSRGGRAFPATVLETVAEQYHQVRQKSVRRSLRKRSIIATLLFYSCINSGFSRRKGECALFAQLPTRGIARGNDYVRTVDEEFRRDPARAGEGLGIDLDLDLIAPHIVTAFHQLELKGQPAEYYAGLHAPIRATVETAKANHIGTDSILRTKVLTATYEVLRRSLAPVPLDMFTQECGIRKNTMVRFLKNLAAYHDLFEEVYRGHGLESSLSR